MRAGSGGISADFISEAARQREAIRVRRARLALLVPVAVTVVWLAYVTGAGHWERVANNWHASVTMLVGSFVGGATPQGSGAIAFPVFTKVLDVPSEVARTFALCIQTIGMGTAALAILINRRTVEWRAVVIGGTSAVIGFLVALLLVGDRDMPFWPSRLPSAYVRVTFTLVLASMAFVVYLGTKVLLRKVDAALPPMNRRLYLALVVAGLVGGLASALTGSGADVLIYLFIVVLFGIDPRVGLPSSVVAMAAISMVGLVVLGILDGQLSVLLSDGATGHVITLGGQEVTGVGATGGIVPELGTGGAELAARRFDLFGLWLAAVPVATWMGLVGAFVASRMKARHLVTLVIVLAVAEVVSTAIFLDELHAVGGLLLYAVLGLVTMGIGLYLLARYRRVIFGLPGLTLEESLSRNHLDVVPGYERQLEVGRRRDR